MGRRRRLVAHRRALHPTLGRELELTGALTAPRVGSSSRLTNAQGRGASSSPSRLPLPQAVLRAFCLTRSTLSCERF